MSNQTLHPPERFGQREVLQAIEERAHLRLPALQLEAQHGAETALLTRRQLMLWMGRQARVMNPHYLWMLAQQPRDPGCVFLMHAQSRMQRSHAAQGQVAVERRAGRSDAIRPPCQLLVQRLGG